MTPVTKILAIASTLFALPAVADEAACEPRVLESPTAFPMRSQVRGQEGIVYVDVKIDASGRAASTELLRSSGHRTLDRAAEQSIRNSWVFDISDCVRKDLPATHRVAVDYRNHKY